jgi:hypothetical protein
MPEGVLILGDGPPCILHLPLAIAGVLRPLPCSLSQPSLCLGLHPKPLRANAAERAYSGVHALTGV